MGLWALLDNKGEPVAGDVAPFEGKLLVADTRECLERYQDALPYSEGKKLRLAEMTPKPLTRSAGTGGHDG